MSHKMQSPKLVTCTGLGGGAGAIRLPPGEWYQVIHLSPGTVQYRYGSRASGPLYLAVVGAGPVMLHPGTEVFLEVMQGANTDAYIHVRGSIPDRPTEEGYEK